MTYDPGLTKKATRLYPLPPCDISAERIYEDLELPPPEHRNVSRPYVVINMVSSVDGRTAVGGKASRLGSQTDRRTMRNLRAKADAVMVGANTLRAEKLSLGLDEPAGLADEPQPLAIVVTGSGDVPLHGNLILGEGQELLVITPGDVDVRLPTGCGQILAISPDGRGNISFVEALGKLKEDHAVNLLLVEGGPTLNHSLISAGLADELFLTLAPKLIGGQPERTILDGNSLIPKTTQPSKLLSVYLSEDELFLRYGL